MKHRRLVGLVLTCSLITLAPAPAPQDRWSEAKANEWYAGQPWLVGSNYIPATAINELEMWQVESSIRRRSTRSSAGPKLSA
jgi:hypothetical protein